MKKLLLASILLFTFLQKPFAQTKVGPAQQKMLDSLCHCLTILDYSKITTAKQASDAFMDCFTKHGDQLVNVAVEEGVDLADDKASEALGNKIGKNLLLQNCGSFMKLAVIMAKKDDGDSKVTDDFSGTFKRIDNKGFNYIVLTDDNGSEKTFLWLRQFTGSENFMADTAKYVGKKLKISWQEIEVYLPQAKGYYNLKEITTIEVL
jgi:hypothetical protein